MLKAFLPQCKTWLLDDQQTVAGKKMTKCTCAQALPKRLLPTQSLKFAAFLYVSFHSSPMVNRWVQHINHLSLRFMPCSYHQPDSQWAQGLSSIIYCESGFWSSNSNQTFPGYVTQRGSSHTAHAPASQHLGVSTAVGSRKDRVSS